MITTRDIYWLAGLLEGEGSFGLMPHGQPRIQLAMTDRDTVEKAGRILGSQSARAYPQSGNRKPMVRSAVAGKMAVSWMMMLYPLMSLRRQAAIKNALAAWRASRRCMGRADLK